MSATPLARLLRQLQAQLSWRSRSGLMVAGEDRVPPEDALRWLAEHLYQRFFTRWSPPAAESALEGAPSFVARLAAQTDGATCWEDGWVLEHKAPGGVFVTGGGLRLFVERLDGLWPRRATPGSAVAVAMPCARPSAASGFFSLVSRAGRLHADRPMVRFYLNLTPEGAVGILGALARLEGARFEAKVANDPAAYGRVDTGVLYVDPDSFERVATWARACGRRRPRWLRAGTPPLTLPFGRGMAVAESPSREEGGGTESYGEQCCRLVATGVLAALATGAPAKAWIEHVAGAFAQEGLSLERPWARSLDFVETRGRVSLRRRQSSPPPAARRMR